MNGTRWIVLVFLVSIAVSTGGTEPDAERVTLELEPGVEMTFCRIPPGTFVMGSTADEAGRHPDEGPTFSVTISRPFYFGETEVTQRQWMALMDENPSLFSERRDHPVERVTWNETRVFLERLSERFGRTFRLPTEAEWEYACRAGTTSRFHWGDDPEYRDIYAYSWFNPITHAQTMPVASKHPNPWGLYDITGNVWEWCMDWKGPYTAEDKVDPTGPEQGRLRVFRGSSWYDSPDKQRSANRHGHAPVERYSTIGFRVLMETRE